MLSSFFMAKRQHSVHTSTKLALTSRPAAPVYTHRIHRRIHRTHQCKILHKGFPPRVMCKGIYHLSPHISSTPQRNLRTLLRNHLGEPRTAAINGIFNDQAGIPREKICIQLFCQKHLHDLLVRLQLRQALNHMFPILTVDKVVEHTQQLLRNRVHHIRNTILIEALDDATSHTMFGQRVQISCSFPDEPREAQPSLSCCFDQRGQDIVPMLIFCNLLEIVCDGRQTFEEKGRVGLFKCLLQLQGALLVAEHFQNLIETELVVQTLRIDFIKCDLLAPRLPLLRRLRYFEMIRGVCVFVLSG